MSKILTLFCSLALCTFLFSCGESSAAEGGIDMEAITAQAKELSLDDLKSKISSMKEELGPLQEKVTSAMAAAKDKVADVAKNVDMEKMKEVGKDVMEKGGDMLAQLKDQLANLKAKIEVFTKELASREG